MQVTVTGRHMVVDETLKTYCIEKAERLPRFLDRIQQIEVIVDGKAGTHTVEMIVHIAGAQPVIGKETKDDAFAALDLLMDKVEEQLRRQKERHRNRKHPPRGGGVQSEPE